MTGKANKKPIKAFLMDIDGSLTVQAGPIDFRVGDTVREIHEKTDILIGPATGKGADAAIMLGRGIGLYWDYVSGEGGAQFYHLAGSDPIPIWEAHDLNIDISQLSLFAEIIQLNQLRRTFLFRDSVITYRPELKEAIVAMFPPGKDIEATKDWVPYFAEVITTHKLDLVVKRHGDGAIDIIPRGVSKRLGVNMVCNVAECDPISILTVVDGSNDHELAEGTTAIAVGNAAEDIKEIVSRQGGFLASLPDGAGFAEGILYYARMSLLPEVVKDIVLRNFPEVDTDNSRPR